MGFSCSFPMKTTPLLIPEGLVQFLVACHSDTWASNDKFSESVYPSCFCLQKEAQFSPWLLKAYAMGKLRKVQMNYLKDGS